MHLIVQSILATTVQGDIANVRLQIFGPQYEVPFREFIFNNKTALS
jgi:hypothetical protein